MAMYVLGLVVAPAIGPVICGWLTDNYSWRWIFYINIPFGIVSLLLTDRIVEEPPQKRAMQQQAQHIPIDFSGVLGGKPCKGALFVVLREPAESIPQLIAPADRIVEDRPHLVISALRSPGNLVGPAGCRDRGRGGTTVGRHDDTLTCPGHRD